MTKKLTKELEWLASSDGEGCGYSLDHKEAKDILASLLCEQEKRFIDHSICFLLANWEEENEEALGMDEGQAALLIPDLQRKYL